MNFLNSFHYLLDTASFDLFIFLAQLSPTHVTLVDETCVTIILEKKNFRFMYMLYYFDIYKPIFFFFNLKYSLQFLALAILLSITIV